MELWLWWLVGLSGCDGETELVGEAVALGSMSGAVGLAVVLKAREVTLSGLLVA